MTSRQGKMDYFWEAFDSHLRAGETGPGALRRAATDYRKVFFTDDGRTAFARAASVALEELQKDDQSNC